MAVRPVTMSSFVSNFKTWCSHGVKASYELLEGAVVETTQRVLRERLSRSNSISHESIPTDPNFKESPIWPSFSTTDYSAAGTLDIAEEEEEVSIQSSLPDELQCRIENADDGISRRVCRYIVRGDIMLAYSIGRGTDHPGTDYPRTNDPLCHKSPEKNNNPNAAPFVSLSVPRTRWDLSTLSAFGVLLVMLVWLIGQLVGIIKARLEKSYTTITKPGQPSLFNLPDEVPGGSAADLVGRFEQHAKNSSLYGQAPITLTPTSSRTPSKPYSLPKQSTNPSASMSEIAATSKGGAFDFNTNMTKAPRKLSTFPEMDILAGIVKEKIEKIEGPKMKASTGALLMPSSETAADPKPGTPPIVPAAFTSVETISPSALVSAPNEVDSSLSPATSVSLPVPPSISSRSFSHSPDPGEKEIESDFTGLKASGFGNSKGQNSATETIELIETRKDESPTRAALVVLPQKPIDRTFFDLPRLKDEVAPSRASALLASGAGQLMPSPSPHTSSTMVWARHPSAPTVSTSLQVPTGTSSNASQSTVLANLELVDGLTKEEIERMEVPKEQAPFEAGVVPFPESRMDKKSVALPKVITEARSSPSTAAEVTPFLPTASASLSASRRSPFKLSPTSPNPSAHRSTSPQSGVSAPVTKHRKSPVAAQFAVVPDSRSSRPVSRSAATPSPRPSNKIPLSRLTSHQPVGSSSRSLHAPTASSLAKARARHPPATAPVTSPQSGPRASAKKANTGTPSSSSLTRRRSLDSQNGGNAKVGSSIFLPPSAGRGSRVGHRSSLPKDGLKPLMLASSARELPAPLASKKPPPRPLLPTDDDEGEDSSSPEDHADDSPARRNGEASQEGIKRR